jgi:hypothetical protein
LEADNWRDEMQRLILSKRREKGYQIVILVHELEKVELLDRCHRGRESLFGLIFVSAHEKAPLDCSGRAVKIE